MILRFILLVCVLAYPGICSKFCELPFEGFGVFLGSVPHLSNSPPGQIKKTLDLVYNDLGIRLYRTSYEQYMSPNWDEYEIECNTPSSCHWDEMHREIAKYKDIRVFASIWIAPYYMMDMSNYELPEKNELAYLYFIRNITKIIKDKYGIEIEKISPINEPENVFASWDHTNVSPLQLCGMVEKFNDTLISLCPENSYFWVSDWYSDFKLNSTECNSICSVHVTHAYAPNLDPSSPNFPLAYYDLTEYTDRGTNKPIWMTEVSSTWIAADKNQMQEALDMGTNIVNMLGTTCIQRYYFWYAYTKGHSGESLIWGDDQGGLFLPKKYYAYKHFTTASSNVAKPVSVRRCDDTDDDERVWGGMSGVSCISFGDKNAVFLNKNKVASPFINMTDTVCETLCCTDEKNDYQCEEKGKQLPAYSVCACHNIIPRVLSSSGSNSLLSEPFIFIIVAALYTFI